MWEVFGGLGVALPVWLGLELRVLDITRDWESDDERSLCVPEVDDELIPDPLVLPTRDEPGMADMGCGCDILSGDGDDALACAAIERGRLRSRPRSLLSPRSRVVERDREPDGERAPRPPSSEAEEEMRRSGTWCRTVGPATGSNVA